MARLQEEQAMMSHFTTDFDAILAHIDSFDPARYGKKRNFLDGGVSRLSPYISRGVISTRLVLERLIDRGYKLYQMEKFVQELAWRDYWQQVWLAKSDAINIDLKRPQEPVESHEVSRALLHAETGIQAIDEGIETLYDSGYMHNHLRMYTAAIACNFGRCHWLQPARWMYYHLLDGDWASNTLSWQWVAGSNANKKYIANQANVNKYCGTGQSGTFIDGSYEALAVMDVPPELAQREKPNLDVRLPDFAAPNLDSNHPLLVYTSYNLDPKWKADVEANRVLLLEPSHFAGYPISPKVLSFILELGSQIPGLQVFTGEFHELKTAFSGSDIYYKEHPLSKHFEGIEESRDWMSGVTGYFPSFFGFWKKCHKELKREFS